MTVSPLKFCKIPFQRFKSSFQWDYYLVFKTDKEYFYCFRYMYDVQSNVFLKNKRGMDSNIITTFGNFTKK